MRLWAASVRALPVTFVIFAVEACAALLAGLPAALELTRAAPQGGDALAQAAWLELLLSAAPIGRAQAWTALLVAGLLALLSPWLQMAWLHALAQGGGTGAALAHGARLYLRAWTVNVLCALGALLAAAPWAAAAWAASAWLGGSPNARVHDLVLGACLVPVLPVLFACHSWSDLSRARALEEAALTSVRRSLRSALRPGLQLAAAFYWLLGHALFVAALLLSQTAWGGAPAVHVGLVQAGVLLRLLVRSRWLATALACAEQAGRSRALR